MSNRTRVPINWDDEAMNRYERELLTPKVRGPNWLRWLRVVIVLGIAILAVAALNAATVFAILKALGF